MQPEDLNKCLTYLRQKHRTSVAGVFEYICSPRSPVHSVPQTRRTAALESQQQTFSLAKHKTTLYTQFLDKIQLALSLSLFILSVCLCVA